jgi:glycosyltransferase involved in cell wall biosynthesis
MTTAAGAGAAPRSIDVIVPVRDEEEVLEHFHARVCAIDLPLHLVYVDNASTDRTPAILRSFQGVTVIQHERDEGYGGSILDGFARSTADAIVVIDADCEYPPESIPALVAALAEHEVVYTSRFLGGRPAGMPGFRRFGNRFLTGVFNLLFRQRLTDLYTGCKALRRPVLEGLELERRGFEHVLELAVRLSRRGVRIAEVPIEYTPRSTGRSKMSHLSETVKLCALLVRYWLAA